MNKAKRDAHWLVFKLKQVRHRLPPSERASVDAIEKYLQIHHKFTPEIWVRVKKLLDHAKEIKIAADRAKHAARALEKSRSDARAA